MPGIFVAVFWIWLAVAGAIIVYRLVTTGTIRDDGRTRSKPTPEDDATAAAERQAAFEAQLAATRPADDRPEPTASTPATPLTTDPSLHVDPWAEPDPQAPRVHTLAEALEGIAMPADLVPYAGETVDPRHMLFATDTAAAEDVGSSLADELERLGFALEPLDERSVAAIKPDARVEVRILPADAPGASPLAGRIPPGSVVAEFQLG